MMRTINCYFWVDGKGTDDTKAVIRPLCSDCHDERFPRLGWHYFGEVGPWEFRCSKCDVLIIPAEKPGQKNSAEPK